MMANNIPQTPSVGDDKSCSYLKLFEWKAGNIECWIESAEKKQPTEELLTETFESQMEDGLASHKLLTVQKNFIDELNLFKSLEFESLGDLSRSITDSERNDPKGQVRIRYCEYLKNRLDNLMFDSEMKFHRSISVFKLYDDHLLKWLSQSHKGSLDIYNRIENTVNPHPVASNDVVLQIVFKFFTLNTLKQCRLVCRKWHYISTSILKTQVAITFTNLKEERTPENWNSDGFLLPGIEFSAFKFKGMSLWDYRLFSEFVIGASMFINELTLDGIAFNLGHSSEVDITSLLANHNLKSLHIKRSLFQIRRGDRLRVSLDSLGSVKFLTLQCCTVLLSTRSPQISPKEVEFAYLRFIQDGHPAAAVLVNQFVDLKQIDKLHLCDTIENSLVIDLSEAISATSLKLSKTLVTDWENARWQVDHLSLGCIPFKEKSLMKMRELEICLAEVNLTVLPQTVEKLILEEVSLVSSRKTPIDLPNLNHLEISSSDVQDLSYLAVFENCPKLIELRLMSSRKRNLDLRIVPSLVKKLTVSNVRLVGDTDRQFDIVRLLNQPLGHIKYVVTHFSLTDKLIVETSNDIQVYDNGHYDEYNVIHLLENKHFKTLILGKFMWNNHFWKSPMCEYFDCEAKFYLIENFKAKAIQDAEFREFLV